MSSRPARIHVVLVTAALTCCAVLSSSRVTAQQLPAPKPKSGTPTENTPTAATRPVASPGIGEFTPVPPSALPAERIEGERATPADLGRLVEWLAYMGADPLPLRRLRQQRRSRSVSAARRRSRRNRSFSDSRARRRWSARAGLHAAAVNARPPPRTSSNAGRRLTDRGASEPLEGFGGRADRSVDVTLGMRR